MALKKNVTRCAAREGFTLIETLVAVTVLSIVLAALYSGFFISGRAIDAVGDSLIRLQEARAVVDTLKRELESAFYSQEGGYSLFRLSDRDFYGRQASQLIFTSFCNISPGLSSIAYTVEEKNGSLALKKKITSAFDKTSEGRDFELIDDVGSFTIEARYNDAWVKTWDSNLANRIPDEMMITITINTKRRGTGREDASASDAVTISDTARCRTARAMQ